MKTQWELELVEKPFCEQLKVMGWQWLEGDTDVPELTERANFHEVMLKGRLRAALSKLNLRDGKPWLGEARIERAIADLERLCEHRVMEANQAATQLLLKGTVADGLPDWDNGRNQPVRFIDFEHPTHNDFLVINQFKVELTSGRGHVIPDAVLFVNGIPLVPRSSRVPAFKSRWRALSPEQRRLRRWREIPRQVAASMAFEGEPVDLAWLTKLHPPTPPPAGSKPAGESSVTRS